LTLKTLITLLIGILTLCTAGGLSDVNALTSTVSDQALSLNHDSTTSSCNCVVFRVDDIQDNFHDNAQLAIMNEFILKNQSISLGLIMHIFGNDTNVLDKVMEGYKKGLFELALHGWDHVDYKNLSENMQQESLSTANGKMTDIFGRPSKIFIPPFNTFNNSTLDVMQKLGLRVISAEPDLDPGPYFVANGSSNYTDNYNLYHLPQTTEFNTFEGDNLIKVPLNDIINNVTKNISRYGYAIITMHPQYFSSVSTPDIVDEQKINDLNYVINHLVSSNIKIVSFSRIVGLKPVALSNGNNASAFATLQNSTHTTRSMGNNSTNLMGSIASLQNNGKGKPAWLLQGQWNMKLAEPLEANRPNATATVFNASFVMLTLNGSLLHTHTISDFKQTSSAFTINGNKTSATFNGTATITMTNGSINYSSLNHIPISLRIIQNNLLSIWADPQKTAYHFGDTAIYGTVYKNGQVLQSSQGPMKTENRTG
jgi:peptidoglycan/xylan/chitin deacetylase (PgdA/CDA1 family)